jgi:hypothetical protein
VTYIVKPDRDEDFYVLWSDIVEAPTAFGPRAYLEGLRQWRHDPSPERFDRADAYGCSAMWPEPDDPIYGFGDAEGMIYMQRGWLRRDRLKAACERLGADENDPITDLLEPFEDESEARPA